MKNNAMISFVLLIIGTVLCGPNKFKSFEQELCASGIDSINISKMILVGSESYYSSGISIVIENQYIMKSIYGHFRNSEPYDKWMASGYLYLRLLKNDGSEVQLIINETDFTALKDSKKSYRCEGLSKYLNQFLIPFSNEIVKEFKRKQ